MSELLLDESELVLLGAYPDYPGYRVHKRIYEKSGDIVDLGCLNWHTEWNWEKIKQWRIVGIDPYEKTVPPDAILCSGVIGCTSGEALISNSWVTSNMFELSKEYIKARMLSFNQFAEEYSITDISLLKMNIEAYEYPLLISLPIRWFEHIDQMLISFHDETGGYAPNTFPLSVSENATKSIIQYLSNWYDYTVIYRLNSWVLFIKR